jgi:uncharacterized protein (TIGR03437 family)
MFIRPKALLISFSMFAFGQQSTVNIGGTWRLTTTSFSATIKIMQTGTTLSGQFVFSGTPCATTAPFTGFISTIFTPSASMNVNMNGQVGFSGDIAANGSSMTGQYSGASGGCIPRGPFNWTATRSSLTIAPTISGVTNAASGATGPVAPGEIISLFANASLSPVGPTPGVSLQLDQNGKVANTLGGVRVHFLGIETYAPLTFVSAGQINLEVPYEVADLANVNIQVEYLGQASDQFTLPVGAIAPGLFTASGTGFGQGAILNHDGVTLNGPSHPEQRGSIIVLFLTGEGQTTPAGVSGKVTTVSSSPPLTPMPVGNVSVLINGQVATVAFAGEAPGLVSGVLQLNVTIPASASPGTVPVQVAVGGKSTQSGVTVSIQ